jgi:hypothetical protein
MGTVTILAEWKQSHAGWHRPEPQPLTPFWPWEFWLVMWGLW